MAIFELTVDPEMLQWLKISNRQKPTEEHFEGFFPVEDVVACLDVPAEAEKYANKEACPLCMRPSSLLRWIRYSSPAVSWERGGGVIGVLSLCTHCNIQVQFIAFENS
jgi:hypothetical protein